MKDKLYKCPECNVSNTGDEWNKKTIEFCGTDDIHPIEKDEFGNFFHCPNCEKEIDAMSIITEDAPREQCKYCEVDVNNRKNIFIIETDYVDYEIYVDGNNNLSSDFPYGKKINFCPMCGREL